MHIELQYMYTMFAIIHSQNLAQHWSLLYLTLSKLLNLIMLSISKSFCPPQFVSFSEQFETFTSTKFELSFNLVSVWGPQWI